LYKLVDPLLRVEQHESTEIMECVKVALLCIHHVAKHRPIPCRKLSVSYTHLDVYKRQGLYHVGSCHHAWKDQGRAGAWEIDQPVGALNLVVFLKEPQRGVAIAMYKVSRIELLQLMFFSQSLV
ncbi:hypothetical protein BAE44_0009310, partial [Dichanthelium oligosanthes]